MLCASWCRPAYSAHRDQPFQLQALAAFAPLAPQDLRLGAGLAFSPARTWFWRADVVQHQAGGTLNRRFTLGDVVELTAGAGVYYDFTVTGSFLKRLVPQITVGRVTF